MINFDITSNTDSNGFVRLNTVKNFDKFVNMFRRMDSSVPSDPNKALYKNYNVKVHCADGIMDFAAMPPAEVFINRIKKCLPTGWVIWSCYPKTSGYTYGEKNRVNLFFYVYDYEYTNTHKIDYCSIVIKWIDIHGETGKFAINVNDLHDIIFKVMSDDEVNKYKEYINFISQKAAPIYKLMQMKQDYKDDYQMYLTDCAEYGFKPVDKTIIDQIRIEMDGVVSSFTPEGTFGWAPNDDTIIVNVYPDDNILS